MSDKKDKEASGIEDNQALDDGRGSTASRARNKTVMLSPEMTGEVRAMLQQQGVAPAMDSPSQPESSQFAQPAQPNAMDSLFSSSDRIETRSTSVIDTDSIQGYESQESFEEPEVDTGFDPMTALVSSAPPLSGFPTESVDSSQDSYAVEPTPSPAVESPEPAGFSVSQPKEVPVSKPAASSAAPRTPVPLGPKGWHSVVSSREDKGRLVGLLVSYDALDEGEIFEIRSGRFLITSRATDNGDYLLVDDDSISPLHAIVRVTEAGAIQILDQLSEFGTGLCRAGESEEEEVAGGLATVEHGDTIRFGKRYFVVVSIPAVVKPDNK